jgi:hypothetical protein
MVLYFKAESAFGAPEEQFEDVEWAEQKNILYSQEDLEFRLAEVPKWFRTFYRNTNEKVILQQTFTEVLKSVSLKSISSLETCSEVNDPKSSTHDNYIGNLHTVVDLGCCSGDLHLRIADSLAHELSTQNITTKVDFLGIDQDPFRLIEAHKAMVERGFANIMHMSLKDNLFKKDFFQRCYIISELKKYEMDSADFIISSHIAYYAPNITKFVESILNFRSKNGFALFIHESEYSIGKVLPLNYNVPINSLTDTQIAETLIKFGAKVYYKTLHSNIELLLGIKEFINDWKADLCNYSACIDTQMLLEFIFQIPFSILRKKGHQESLIQNLKNLSKINDENIYLKLNIELVVPDAFTLTDTEEKQYGYYKNFQDINSDSLYAFQLVEI